LTIGKIAKIGKTYKHFNRYRQIISILVKYGFGDILQKLNITKFINIGKSIFLKKSIIPREIKTEVRIRKVFEELGPAFIKLGQILSTRPDLVPPDLIQELRKLQDTVPSFPSDQAIHIIEEESGKPLDEVFLEFDKSPIASASISQVHFARLKNNDEVVVKVQRPEIRKIIEIDIEIMLHLANLLERYIEEMKTITPIKIIEEFARSIEKEIDFNLELSNVERFRNNLSEDDTIYIPRVYKNLSTEKILVMEHIRGAKLSEIDLKGYSESDKKLIVRRGARLILKQIFDFGFFHADPHPGKLKEDFGDLVIGIVTKDTNQIMRSLIKLSYSIELKDKNLLERDVNEILDEFIYKNLNEISISKLFQRFLNLLILHKIKINPEFYLLMKTLLTIEGVGRNLDPDFNLIEHLEPFTIRIIADKYNVKKILSETRTTFFDILDIVRNLPETLDSLISKIKSGSLKIEYEHKGLEQMFGNHERAMNNLTIALIIMSIFISSSLIILSKIPPLWNDISILGLIGMVIASGMSVIILFSLVKKRKN
jgi:ubiquinone biosynthesis protein